MDRNIELSLEELNRFSHDSMVERLGIRYTLATRNRVEGIMPVDERTCQPFGYLAGGSSLAMAETLAGLGSLLYCKENELPVGTQVSGNHISAVPKGSEVHGVAVPLHIGKTTHVWNVEILTTDGRLVSTSRVVNVIIQKAQQ